MVVLGDALGMPEFGAELIGPDQQAVHLLAHVPGCVGFPQEGQVNARFHQFGYVAEEDVLMLHGHDGQVEPDHGPDGRGPQPGAVDHVFAGDITLFGVNDPFPGRGSGDVLHRVEAVYLGPAHPGPLGQGLGHSGRIDVAVLGMEQTAQQPLGVHVGVDLHAFVHGAHPGVDPGDLVLLGRVDEFQHPFRFGGDAQAARSVPARILSGFLLQGGVKLDGVVVDLGHVEAIAVLRRISGGQPGGPGSQFIFFNQHHIRPAQLGQMVQGAASADSASNDYNTRLALHCLPPLV